MKYLYLLLFLSFFVQTTYAQSFTKSFPESFESSLSHTTALSDGTVILAISYSGKNTEYLYKNGLKALTPTGEVIWEDNLSLEGGTNGYDYIISDMKATPDGGWIVSGTWWACDYTAAGFVVKYSSNFVEEWALRSDDVLPNASIGSFSGLQISSDKIHLYSFNSIVSIDYSGNLLEHVELEGYLSFAVAEDSKIYAFAEDSGWEILTYPDGILTEEVWTLGNDLSKIEILDEEENIFLLTDHEEETTVYRDFEPIQYHPYNENLQKVHYFKDSDGNITAAEMYEEGYSFLLSYNGMWMAQIGEFSYQEVEDIEIMSITRSGNQIMLGGYERYVPTPYYQKQTVATVFVHSLFFGALTPELDLALTDISLSEPVTTSIVNLNPENEARQYTFRNIEITVTNNSEETVESFAVNTTFDFPAYAFCEPRLNHTERIENATLAAGESQTVFIDSLVTYSVYDTANYQLCFWVTHPNNELDFNGENDNLCVDFVKDFISPTEYLLSQVSLKVYPNPTTDYLYFEENSQFEEYAIFSLEGKQMGTGNLREGQGINIKELPKGVYFLQASSNKERTNLKFVKQ